MKWKRKGQELWKELKKYGYEFSLKRECFHGILIVCCTLGLGYLFHLSGVYLLLLCGWVLGFVPFFVRNLYKNHYEEQHFADANIYMEQFLYSFQKSGKILASLEDVAKLFATGTMHEAIENAIDCMKHDYEENNVAKKALGLIEEEYPIAQLHTVHNFVLKVEKNGGAYGDSILFLLDMRRTWADRVCHLVKEKNHKRGQILASIITSLLLCYLLLFVAQSVDVDITQYSFTRITTLLVLMLDFFLYYEADCRLSSSYANQPVDEKALLNTYRKLKNAKRDGKRILGKRIMTRRLIRGIQEVFPQWLMEVSLLLQSENVQVAIQKSYQEAPLLLKPEIKLMQQKLQSNPADMEPYMEFFGDFPVPEIQSAMKMLYSISEGAGGNATYQITDIIRRNQALLDQAERMKGEDAIGGLYGLFLAPQLTGGMKLLADMLAMFYGLVMAGVWQM